MNMALWNPFVGSHSSSDLWVMRHLSMFLRNSFNSERGECPFGEGRMPLRLSRGKAGRPAKIKDVAK